MASPCVFGQNTQIEYKMADSPYILLIKTENHILLRSHKWIHVYFARHTCSPIVSLHRPPTPWNGKYKYVTQRCNLNSLILSDLFVMYMTASEQGCIVLMRCPCSQNTQLRYWIIWSIVLVFKGSDTIVHDRNTKRWLQNGLIKDYKHICPQCHCLIGTKKADYIWHLQDRNTKWRLQNGLLKEYKHSCPQCHCFIGTKKAS